MSRTLVAALYFTLLARTLGVKGYGAFAAICSLASMLAPFSGLGSGNLLVREIARDSSAFPSRWADCLLFTAVSGTALTAAAVLAARVLLPRGIPSTMLVCICLADLIFARILDLAGMAFQAFEKLHITAWFSFGLSACRLVAAAALALTRGATASAWSQLYLASTAVAAVSTAFYVGRNLGAPRFRWCFARRDLMQGSTFSISLAAQTIYNDIDKTMLARLVSLEAAGLYGAAYRIVDAAFSPVNAIMHAAYPRFFQSGERGLTCATSFALRLLPRALIYCVTASIGAYALAPFLPVLLGGQFASSLMALRLLLPLLVLRSTHVFAADALTGSGHQGLRTLIQITVAGLNVALNFAWLPRLAWRGACYSTLVCDGLLALLLWSGIALLLHKKKQQPLVLSPVR